MRFSGSKHVLELPPWWFFTNCGSPLSVLRLSQSSQLRVADRPSYGRRRRHLWPIPSLHLQTHAGRTRTGHTGEVAVTYSAFSLFYYPTLKFAPFFVSLGDFFWDYWCKKKKKSFHISHRCLSGLYCAHIMWFKTLLCLQSLN